MWVRLFCFPLILALLSVAPAVASPSHWALGLYGARHSFDVVREGAKVGEHVTEFRQQGQILLVKSRMSLKLSVLFIPVYHFEYRSSERWFHEQLQHLEVAVDDNGEAFALVAERHGQALMLHSGGSTATAPLPLFTTNHWNAAVVQQDRVLNTLTGGINKVRILDKGLEPLPLADGSTIEAHRYVYTGELRTEVWYDQDGRWVGLRFKGGDGSTIEYRCRTCSAKPAAYGNPS